MWIEVRQDVVVHRAERGLRPVFHAFVERVLDSTLEIWARVNGRDGRALLVGDLIELLAEYVRLHAESDQMYFGSEVFGDAGSGVKKRSTARSSGPRRDCIRDPAGNVLP